MRDLHWSIKAVLVVAASLPAPSVLAMQFITDLERSQWQVSSSRFECSLKHTIEGYGHASFRHAAGAGREFLIEGESLDFAPTGYELLVEPPNWVHDRPARSLAQFPEQAPRRLTDTELVTDMLDVLLGGMQLSFTGNLEEREDEPLKVMLSNAGVRNSFEDFKACEARLLPVGLAQVERVRVQYQNREIGIPEASLPVLRNIAQYVKNDPSIRSIYVDGHTDNLGSRRDNISTSEKRAQRVTEYLKSLGVPASKLVTRYHGEQYPVVANDSEVNRAKNRRTTIRLSRAAPVRLPALPSPDTTETASGDSKPAAKGSAS